MVDSKDAYEKNSHNKQTIPYTLHYSFFGRIIYAIESASSPSAAVPGKHAGAEAAGGAPAVAGDEPAQDPGEEDPGLRGSELPQVEAPHHGLLQTSQGESQAARRP